HGELAAAQRSYDEALSIAREIDDEWRVGILLTNLGDLALTGHRYEEARAYAQQALETVRHTGEGASVAMNLSNLAFANLNLGDVDAAADQLSEAIRIFERLSFADGVAICLEGFAALTAARGNGEAAVRLM